MRKSVGFACSGDGCCARTAAARLAKCHVIAREIRGRALERERVGEIPQEGGEETRQTIPTYVVHPQGDYYVV